jgi:serine/threonine protein kinase
MTSLQGTLLDGRYRLGGRLGTGGMSIVHAAHDVQLDREVAVKLVQTVDATDETVAERLFREARAAARVAHPALVTVFAHGTAPDLGFDYLVMERLFGEDLRSRLDREGALPVSLVHAIAVDVADVLHAVHPRGNIHRDLKPSNIFLGQRGRRSEEVRVLDFGVAKQLDLWTLTKPGTVLGTFGYMAPEQLLEGRVDARSDIYALGLVLFECLTGSRVFTDTTFSALARAMREAKHSSLRARRPELPHDLCQVVERCLEQAPDDRFQSAGALRDALLALPHAKT